MVPEQRADSNHAITAYLFTDGLSARRDLIGAITERGVLLGFITLMFLLIGGFGLLLWTLQDTGWNGTLVLLGFVVVLPVWNYLSLVMEVRVTGGHLSFRRLGKFRSISWEMISRVRVYGLRTVGGTYVVVKGRSFLPLAFFPLWIPWHRPEPWEDLLRLIEQIARRVPIKHTS